MLIENEIRPEALMAEQARLFAEDTGRLMARRSEFVVVPCPACESNTYQPAFEKCRMTFVKCGKCETIYANPRPTPELLAYYYQNSKNYEYWSKAIFPASESVRREKIFKPRVERVLELCRRFGVPGHVLLEVGAGFGLFCEEMVKTDYFERVVALEPTPYLADDCRQRRLEVVEKPVEQVNKSELLNVEDGETMNVIASFEVIEHLFSPGDFLMQCASLLDAGGLLMITCPNSKGFDIATLQEKSGAVDVEHITLFNPESLGYLMERCGFDVIERQTPGQLDAELVRKQVLCGELDLSAQPFLQHVLIDAWEEKGQAFQQFLVEQRLSSNMLLVGRKR